MLLENIKKITIWNDEDNAIEMQEYLHHKSDIVNREIDKDGNELGYSFFVGECISDVFLEKYSVHTMKDEPMYKTREDEEDDLANAYAYLRNHPELDNHL